MTYDPNLMLGILGTLYLYPVISIERKLSYLVTIIDVCPNCPKKSK